MKPRYRVTCAPKGTDKDILFRYATRFEWFRPDRGIYILETDFNVWAGIPTVEVKRMSWRFNV